MGKKAKGKTAQKKQQELQPPVSPLSVGNEGDPLLHHQSVSIIFVFGFYEFKTKNFQYYNILIADRQKNAENGDKEEIERIDQILHRLKYRNLQNAHEASMAKMEYDYKTAKSKMEHDVTIKLAELLSSSHEGTTNDLANALLILKN